eukprot:22628-Hanusia_phi.AAC.3
MASNHHSWVLNSLQDHKHQDGLLYLLFGISTKAGIGRQSSRLIHPESIFMHVWPLAILYQDANLEPRA